MTHDLSTWEDDGGRVIPDTYADTAEAVGALVVTDTRARWKALVEHDA